MSICITKPGHHWFRKWFVTCSVPSHYLNQCLLLVIEHLKTNFGKILFEIQTFSFKEMMLKCHLQNDDHFFLSLNLLGCILLDINRTLRGILIMSVHWMKCWHSWHEWCCSIHTQATTNIIVGWLFTYWARSLQYWWLTHWPLGDLDTILKILFSFLLLNVTG